METALSAWMRWVSTSTHTYACIQHIVFGMFWTICHTNIDFGYYSKYISLISITLPCPLSQQVRFLQKRDVNGRIRFTDISLPSYSPTLHGGVTFDESMRRLRAGETTFKFLYGSNNTNYADGGDGINTILTINLNGSASWRHSGNRYGGISADIRGHWSGMDFCSHKGDNEWAYNLQFPN